MKSFISRCRWVAMGALPALATACMASTSDVSGAGVASEELNADLVPDAERDIVYTDETKECLYTTSWRDEVGAATCAVTVREVPPQTSMTFAAGIDCGFVLDSEVRLATCDLIGDDPACAPKAQLHKDVACAITNSTNKPLRLTDEMCEAIVTDCTRALRCGPYQIDQTYQCGRFSRWDEPAAEADGSGLATLDTTSPTGI